mmetsp:Transcript_14937/g.36540  ORF Transcript_14937/g.36540 Transcript_14937/m.36540 type:complete len:230 (+) Transcript_14937:937-1626(+)
MGGMLGCMSDWWMASSRCTHLSPSSPRQFVSLRMHFSTIFSPSRGFIAILRSVVLASLVAFQARQLRLFMASTTLAKDPSPILSSTRTPDWRGRIDWSPHSSGLCGTVSGMERQSLTETSSSVSSSLSSLSSSVRESSHGSLPPPIIGGVTEREAVESLLVLCDGSVTLMWCEHMGTACAGGSPSRLSRELGRGSMRLMAPRELWCISGRVLRAMWNLGFRLGDDRLSA